MCLKTHFLSSNDTMGEGIHRDRQSKTHNIFREYSKRQTRKRRALPVLPIYRFLIFILNNDDVIVTP